jgi:hypothetical protein
MDHRGPLVVLILVMAGGWFGREVFNGIDRIYKPKVQAWIDKHRLKDYIHQPARRMEEGACHVEDPECRDSEMDQHPERTCAQEMQERVRILTQTKGLTGPDRGGRYKALLKEEFVANMMAIQRKCLSVTRSCHSNLDRFTHLYIKDLTQCWCLPSQPQLASGMGRR